MDAIEAESLLATIIADRGPGSASVRQLGNGSYVVIIVPSQANFSYWCWSPGDYHAFRAARTCSLCQHEATNVKECVGCHRSVCVTCRTVQDGIKCVECALPDALVTSA